VSEVLTPEKPPLPTYYTVDEVAAHVKADKATVLAAIHDGELKAGRVGRRYLVLPSAVAEWLSRVAP
jgi:excisionase family DNA binding protein